MSTAQEVEMGEVEGPALTALISFMCGRLGTIPTDILPLCIAADVRITWNTVYVVMFTACSGVLSMSNHPRPLLTKESAELS
jgi:hypothetical protein